MPYTLTFNFIETRLFTRLARQYLSDDDYSQLQRLLIRNPEEGFERRSRMSTKRDIGAEILQGIKELKAGKSGRVISIPPIAEIREKTGLSQSRFATLLGVSVRTLQDWEQGRRAPSGAARTLLAIAYRNPQALLDVA